VFFKDHFIKKEIAGNEQHYRQSRNY
jgi:hypothetical protein